MESRSCFSCYHAGDVPPAKEAEGSYHLPLLGFRNKIPVLQKPPVVVSTKALVLKTDPSSGKKFIEVKGKRVELTQVKRTIKKNEAGNSKVMYVKKTNRRDVSTSTDLSVSKDVCVQTDPPPLEEYLDGPLIRDVRMGQGPRCPTPRVDYDFEKFPLVSQPQEVAVRINPLIEQLRWDFENCLQRDLSGNMPIHCAVLDNDFEKVSRQCVALRYKRDGSLNVTNYSGFTPLQLAVYNQVDLRIFETLLEYGADPSAVDTEGNNVIHLTVQQGNAQIMEVVLSKRGDLGIDCFNYEGLTPLMLCAEGQATIAKVLLKNGADPNIRDQKSGRTALFHGLEANNEDFVRLLLEYNADTKIKNFVGMSPHDAVFEIENLNQGIVLMMHGKEHVQIQHGCVIPTKSKRKAPTSPEEEPGKNKNVRGEHLNHEKILEQAKSRSEQMKLRIERTYEKVHLKKKDWMANKQ